MLANYYTFTVPEEFVDQVIKQMDKVQEHFTNNVKSCIKYQCTRDIHAGNILYVLVIWEDQESYETNLDSEFQKTEIFDKFIDYNAAILSAEQLTITDIADMS